MRRRLYTRIYLHFVGVLLAVGMLTSGAFYTASRFTHRRGAVTRVIGRAAVLFAQRLTQPQALEVLGRQLAEEYEVDITVRDPGGRVLLAVGPELPPLSQGELLGLSPQGPRPHGFMPRFGRGFWVAEPLYLPPPGGVPPLPGPGAEDFLLGPPPELRGELVGVLQVSLGRQFRGRFLWGPLGSVSVLLLVVALATKPLARRISRPVERLTEANRRLGDGDLNYRIRCGGPREGDELLALEQSWNEMAERIGNLVRGHKELLANVSHELRSPLTRVRLALALLEEDDPPAAPLGEAAQREAAARRARLADVEADLGELERLIDDVLTASRLSALGLPLRREEVALLPLLRQLVDRAEATPGLAGQVMLATPEAADVRLYADGALLRRALWNLLENAGKYGAPPIEITVTPAPGWLSITVSDEGPGIAEADRARVLEPFYRGDRARTPSVSAASAGQPIAQRGGFGLGLTLAHRIAEAHDGALTIDSKYSPGSQPRGCRVTLTLPLA